ncbi:site-specific integrase [Mycobacterium intracellulare]|uniref:site-specific integrase n=1 Tax=Mycobacterium intracellulare TaxID=1767 RepID=UPI001E5586FE|nr:site-specific integrase [Mycobacterium intracellulare]
MLDDAIAATGLTSQQQGNRLRFTPHDFRRLFITDAVLNGLPPHIAQVIAGHRDINVTWAIRPSIPTRPSNHIWHSSPAAATCGPPTNTAPPPMRNGRNSWATSNAAKSPLAPADAPSPAVVFTSTLVSDARCSGLTRPNGTVLEIRDNLLARIAEAEREGWLGEVEGLQVSLAGAEDKLAQVDRRSREQAPVELGTPTLPTKTPKRKETAP